MPSATDFQTVKQAIALTSSYVVIIKEQLGQQLTTAVSPQPGQCQTLQSQKFVLNFTVGTVAQSRTLVSILVSPATSVGSQPLYFLPYRQNATTQMTIPPDLVGPGIFMTSTLGGCTVCVSGPPTNPTIAHANSRQSYSGTYNQSFNTLKSVGNLTLQEAHDIAEVRGNTACRAAIDNMLAGTPNNARYVRKADYAGKFTQTNFQRAKDSYKNSMKLHEGLSEFEPKTLGDFQTELGAFVFGIRDPQKHTWQFFYQSSVGISVKTSSYFGFGKKPAPFEEAVMGTPDMFFP